MPTRGHQVVANSKGREEKWKSVETIIRSSISQRLQFRITIHGFDHAISRFEIRDKAIDRNGRIWRITQCDDFVQKNAVRPNVALCCVMLMNHWLEGQPLDWQPSRTAFHVNVVLVDVSTQSADEWKWMRVLLEIKNRTYPKSAILTVLSAQTRTFLAAKSLWTILFVDKNSCKELF